MLTFFKENKLLCVSILISIISVIVLSQLTNLSEDKIRPRELNIFTGILTIAILVIGNTLLGKGFDLILPWKTYPIGRFVSQLLIGTIFSLFALSISYSYIKENFTETPATVQQLVLLNSYGLGILFPIFSMTFGIKFIRSWRKTELEAEQLQKENARSQMQTLKNHLDPHFLFNNLNVLSSLIDHDVEASKEFLDHFAEVYRSFLRSEDQDLVSVNDELKLLDSYTHLLKIRFREGLQISNEIRLLDRESYLPPLSIQMLLENIVKHNVATRTKPVLVRMTSNGSHITVENNIQLKKFDEKTQSGTGLENLKSRYNHFTEQPVVIENDGTSYKVSIPLLAVEEA